MANDLVETELGLLPRAWRVERLRTCLSAAPDYGINAAASQYAERYPAYLRITDISEDGRFAPDSQVSVRHPLASQYFLREGDLVFARTGASVGKCYRYDGNDGRLVFAGFLIRVTPNQDCLLPDYLSVYVRTHRYWSWIRQMSMRSGQPGINGVEYGQLLIPVPPLPEQRAIAAALRDVDGLLASLDKLIAKKRDLKQAAMQQLLTSQTRLPGFQSPLTLTTLGDLFHFRNGVNADKRHYGRGIQFINVLEVITTPHLRAHHIPGRVNIPQNLIDNYLVRKGDVVFNRTSETQEEVALASVYMGEAAVVFGGFVIRGRPTGARLDAAYAGYALRAPEVRRQLVAKGQGAIRANVGQSELQSVWVRLPPLDEQRAIAAVLWDLDAELELLEARRDKTRDIKQGMMQELLTGRTRLV